MINQLRIKSAQEKLSIPLHKLMSLNNSLPSIPSLVQQVQLYWYWTTGDYPKSYKNKKLYKDYTVSQLVSAVYTSAKVQSVWSGFVPFLEENQTKKGWTYRTWVLAHPLAHGISEGSAFHSHSLTASVKTLPLVWISPFWSHIYTSNVAGAVAVHRE